MPLNPMHILKAEVRTGLSILVERAELLTKRDFINTVVSEKRFDADETTVKQLAEKAFNWWNMLNSTKSPQTICDKEYSD